MALAPEPSDAERNGWWDATAEYVASLEAELQALQEATRLRLSKDTLAAVKSWRNALGEMGSRHDRVTAHGLDVLVKREEALARLDAGQ
jgi:hypothetical protein